MYTSTAQKQAQRVRITRMRYMRISNKLIPFEIGYALQLLNAAKRAAHWAHYVYVHYETVAYMRVHRMRTMLQYSRPRRVWREHEKWVADLQANLD